MGFISLPGDKSPWVRPAAHSTGWGGVGSVGGLTSSASGLPRFFNPCRIFPCRCFVLSPSDGKGSQGRGKAVPAIAFLSGCARMMLGRSFSFLGMRGGGWG